MRKNYFDNDDTEILVIPDLDDGGEEDIVSKGEVLAVHGIYCEKSLGFSGGFRRS